MRIIKRRLIFLIIFVLTGCNQQKPESAKKGSSWEKIPRFAMYTHKEGDLSDQDIKKLASEFDIVCIHPCFPGEVRTSKTVLRNEKDIWLIAARLKAVDPDVKLLYYINTILDWPNYEGHSVFSLHPEWQLKDIYGEPYFFSIARGLYKTGAYNFNNPDMRKWWVDQCREAIKNGMDGIFADAVPKTAMREKENRKEWGDENFEKMVEGLTELLKETKQAIGKDNLLIFNGLRGNFEAWDGGLKYLEYTDGAMIEHFAHIPQTGNYTVAPETLENELKLYLEGVKQGKIMLVKAWPDFGPDFWTWVYEQHNSELDLQAKKSITFPLACFLIGAGEDSYFGYSWSYYEGAGWLLDYPELVKKTGKPKGLPVKDGWIYTREFENASVWVNIETQEAKINW